MRGVLVSLVVEAVGFGEGIFHFGGGAVELAGAEARGIHQS